MPTIPLPTGASPLDGGDLPVSDGSDVLAEFPQPHKRPSSAPVRDAFCEAFAEGFKAYQNASSYAAEQCDPLKATGEYLRSLAAEREVYPLPNESDESLRSRLFKAPDIVTPNAIRRTVDALLAPYTTSLCEICEPEVDGWFVGNGTTSWDSFVGDPEPHYQDRLYVDDAAENAGVSLVRNLPGGCIVGDGSPRTFLIRVPVLEAADELFAFVGEMYLGDGADLAGSESDGSVACSVFGDGLTETEIYEAIIGAVEAIKGQGIAWILYADPRL